jgi:hypothetical protein
MSISTPQAGGGNRRPSKAVAGGKPADGKPGRKPAGGKPGGNTKPAKSDTSAKSDTAGLADSAATPKETQSNAAGGARRAAASARRAGSRPGAGSASGAGPRTKPATDARAGGGGGRPPIVPVKVSRGPSWGPIVLFTVVGLVAAGIVGFGVYEVHQNSRGWQSKADSIPGIVDYLKTNPNLTKTANHEYGKLSYPQSPPIGGTHNPNWERCQGDVYPDQVPNENAVHSLEHGAVWITYNPSLPKDQVDKLASKVHGNDFMLMSPYPGLDKPISLQAWGFQLKLDSATDPRIDDFVKDLRQNATREPGTPCSSGSYTTKTGTTPTNLGQSAPPSAPAG